LEDKNSKGKTKENQFYRKEVMANHLRHLPMMRYFFHLIEEVIDFTKSPEDYAEIKQTIRSLL
jgi:hypothetical protein